MLFGSAASRTKERRVILHCICRFPNFLEKSVMTVTGWQIVHHLQGWEWDPRTCLSRELIRWLINFFTFRKWKLSRCEAILDSRLTNREKSEQSPLHAMSTGLHFCINKELKVSLPFNMSARHFCTVPPGYSRWLSLSPGSVFYISVIKPINTPLSLRDMG